MTSEQLRAYANLLIAVSVMVGLGLVFSARGSIDYMGDVAVRRPAATVLLLGAAAWVVVGVGIRTAKGPGGLDERDRRVAAGALRAQVFTLQVLLLLLAIVFTETGSGVGLPQSTPWIMWLVVVLSGLFAHAVATIVGYRRLS